MKLKRFPYWLVSCSTQAYPPQRATITQIVIIDQKDKGGEATLSEGGVGLDYASIHLKSGRNHGMDFIVEIYGHWSGVEGDRELIGDSQLNWPTRRKSGSLRVYSGCVDERLEIPWPEIVNIMVNLRNNNCGGTFTIFFVCVGLFKVLMRTVANEWVSH